MLRLSDLKHTRVYQEGQEDEGLKFLLRLLKRRFGQVAPDVQTKLEQLSLSQVEALGEALLDFSQLNDLVCWLQQNPPAKS